MSIYFINQAAKVVFFKLMDVVIHVFVLQFNSIYILYFLFVYDYRGPFYNEDGVNECEKYWWRNLLNIQVSFYLFCKYLLVANLTCKFTFDYFTCFIRVSVHIIRVPIVIININNL